MPTVLITGTNRGLGLEFTKQFAAAGWRVFACCREPQRAAELNQVATAAHGHVTPHKLDVDDHSQIEALAEELRQEKIDLLLNNAGIYIDRHMKFGELDYKAWEKTLRINVLGPVKLIEAFVDHVAHSDKRLIVIISSKVGSIADNSSGGRYLYRSSKTAVNMAMKSLSIDLAPKGITVVSLHPGWVKTDMGGPNALIGPETSIRSMIELICNLQESDRGKFFNYNGQELPW